MAIDYTPKGRRVGLDGIASRGFNPVQSADQSQSQLRAGSQALESFARAQDSQLKNREKDLEAIVGLSDTASKFMVERQKGINESTRKEYQARALNGDIQIKPEAREAFDKNREQLRLAASGERTQLAELETVDRQAALEIRENDPVLKGWAAYGYAEGLAMRAAGNVSSLANAMQSTEKVIPMPNADGTGVELISPLEARARGPAGFKAAWEYSLLNFITQAGIDNINPILLAERVTPAVMDIRNRLLAQSLEDTAKRQAGIARDSYLNKLGADLTALNTADPTAVAVFVQQATLEGKGALGLLSQGEANKEVVGLLRDLAISRGDRALLENIRSTVVNPQDPNGVTFGDHPIYGPILQDATDKVEARAEAIAANQKALDEAGVNQILTGFQLDASKANDPNDFLALKNKAIGLLQGMGTPAAQEGILKLTNMEFNGQENFLISIEKQLRMGDKSITKRMIQRHITLGDLPPNAMDALKNFFPTDQADAMIEEMRPTINQMATGALTRGLTLNGANPDLIAGLPTRRKQLVGETIEALRKFLAQNKDLSADQVNQFVENLIEGAVTKDERFKVSPNTDKNKPLIPIWAKPLVNGVVMPHPGGPSARPGAVDFSAIPAIEIRGGRPVDLYGGALGEAQQQLEQGRNVSKDIEARAKASGLTLPSFLATQQGQEALSTAGIRANDVLRNPRATPIQRAAARRQLDYVQQNKRTIQPAGGSGASGGIRLTGALGAFAAELGQLEGGARAYEASNMGGAGDKPEGVPGLTRMTVNQVLALPDHHVGKWQLQLGKGRTLDTLRTKMGLTGNEPFTPELQDRMFTELLFGGWKRPELTAYLNGGTDLATAKREFIREWQAGTKMDLDRWLPQLRAQRIRERATGGTISLQSLSRANVLSINLEEPGKDRFQPGVDIFFKDKRFPSLVEGRVKKIDFEAGYGNYVVIETTDPVTGEVYDVLKSHLDSINVRQGDRVRVGTVIGQQGSTGRTSPGGIASIDFLARDGGMRPYRRWREERERVLSLIK